VNRQDIFNQIIRKQSYLCIGLDTDLDKIPSHLLEYADPVYEFNRAIIDATADLCVAYKPNLAFYECRGTDGWNSLQKTMLHIPKGIFTIADAKRGDIGNTSAMYAKAFFEQMDFDAVTVAPYMGADSVKPFLEFRDKWVILLALTSNPGAADFQMNRLQDGTLLYEQVMTTALEWSTLEQLMFVCGATKAEQFGRLRELAPGSFFLVPGVGAQGGDLRSLSVSGMNDWCGLLVNSSRQILYASAGKDFAEAARREAVRVQQEMSTLLKQRFPDLIP